VEEKLKDNIVVQTANDIIEIGSSIAAPFRLRLISIGIQLSLNQGFVQPEYVHFRYI
jgi:hypothetical protein